MAAARKGIAPLAAPATDTAAKAPSPPAIPPAVPPTTGPAISSEVPEREAEDRETIRLVVSPIKVGGVRYLPGDMVTIRPSVAAGLPDDSLD